MKHECPRALVQHLAYLHTSLLQVDALRARVRKAERGLSSTQDQARCVVCIDKPKSVALVPCGHVCMCDGCARRSEISRCPICRHDITSTMAVFL